MSKKNRLKVTMAACLALVMTMGATACDAFTIKDGEADMKQIVASVNISSQLAEDENDYADELATIIQTGGLRTDIPKRDLMAMYMSVGYQYVQSYGYEKTFNLLLDSLIDRKVLVQYAIAYFLGQSSTYTQEACAAYVASETAKATGIEKTLLEKHPEVLTLKYFLTDGGKTTAEDMKDFDKAVYNLHKSVNDSLDSTEKNYIKAKDDQSSGETPRTMPTGVGTEKEDYFISPKNGVPYQIYTGRNDLAVCEASGYEKLDGSTAKTRTKAYDDFLKNLENNYLVLEGEKTVDFTKMDYYYVELANQLETAIISKYTKELEKQGEEDLLQNNPNSYVADRYDETLEEETRKYSEDENAFETALGSLSDTSLPLYAPNAKYGLVYNILIPFSGIQNDLYTQATSRDLTDIQLATYRASLLMDVQAKDLRTSWFSDYEDENYAYQATDYYQSSVVTGASNYLFFEDNFTNSERYEEIGQYYGRYPFNGSVTKNADDEFVLKTNKMNIDTFIDEMEDYLSYATGGLTVGGSEWAGYVGSTGVDKNGNAYDYDEKKETFNDYSQFMYYTGRVTFTETFSPDKYFVRDTQANKAASAFNELMFAYSTDTGCLNTYMGYVVSPYKTSYVPEFEYAAQYAVRELGEGGYVVCPSTYGWHIIYVTFVYDGGAAVYAGFDPDQRAEEGTFSQLYFDMIKNTYVEDYANKVQDTALETYNKGDGITRYPDRYKDLTSLG